MGLTRGMHECAWRHCPHRGAPPRWHAAPIWRSMGVRGLAPRPLRRILGRVIAARPSIQAQAKTSVSPTLTGAALPSAALPRISRSQKLTSFR